MKLGMYNRFSMKKIFLLNLILISILLIMLFPQQAYAAGDPVSYDNNGFLLIYIALILITSKLTVFIKRFKMPSVIGEILAGIVLGNLTLLGINFFEPIKNNEIIGFLSELGVLILLFDIGLHSELESLKKVGRSALIVGIFGALLPFLAGNYLLGPTLLPGYGLNTYLFFGATLTATSISITARILKDKSYLNTREADLILGIAVIDDIVALMGLAVVTSLVKTGSLALNEVLLVVGETVIFLAAAVFAGVSLAPELSNLFSKIHTGTGMKFTLAMTFALTISYAAKLIGLDIAIGAFAAGLVLDPIVFKEFDDPVFVKKIGDVLKDVNEKSRKKISGVLSSHSDRHIEFLMEPLRFFLVPIFFVTTGMSGDLRVLVQPEILFSGLLISLGAVIAKMAAAFFSIKVNKWLVGFGIVPRGEVALVFASIGRSLGVFSAEIFSVLIILVITTTLITPIALQVLIEKVNQ